LWQIDLRGPAVSDAALSYIGRIRTLKLLWLSSRQITDAGLAQLHGLELLEEIHLAGTSVTEAGVDALHNAIPGCRIEWDGGVIEPVATESGEESEE
jgi:hypothetical protein